MTSTQNESESSASVPDGDLNNVIGWARKVGVRIETNEFSNGLASVDFGLFRRQRFEKLHDKGAGSGQPDLSDDAPRSVKNYHRKQREQMERSGLDPDNLGTANFDIATQRSGGFTSSSIIVDSNGAVREYNLRLPPVDGDRRPEKGVVSDCRRICKNIQSGCEDLDDAEVMVRPRLDDEIREDALEQLRQEGGIKRSAPDKEWYTHIRDSQTSVPVSAFLAFAESLFKRYDRRFTHTREWAVPLGEWLNADGTDPLERLRGLTASFDTTTSEGETALTFRLPEATQPSTVRTRGGEVLSYEVVLPTYAPSEYGKILLRKALEHVSQRRGIFLNADQRLDASGEGYRMILESESCSEGLDAIASDAAALVEAYETIQDRSRIS